MRGAFITLEGTEGVGKSTLRERMSELLREHGYTVVVTREPGGTPLGEQIREWILNGDHAALSAEVEALLMFAARGYHIDNVIRPALERGEWVLCDRFTDATFAYQGGGRGASRRLLQVLKAEIHKGLDPDLTILLDAPIEIGFGRIIDRDKDHFEREDRAFFERVRARYLELAAASPARYRIVDAAETAEEVWASVAAELRAFMDRFSLRTAPEGGRG